MISDQRLYNWPPFKGTLSVAALLVMGFVASDIEGVATILVAEAVILLGAVYILAITLSGFLGDLQPPGGPDGMITVASRPRRAAERLSWAGLAVAAVGVPIAGASLSASTPAPMTVLALVVALGGVVIATTLPSRSAKVVARAGGICVSAHGVRVVSSAHPDEEPEPFPASSAHGYSEAEIRAHLDHIESLAPREIEWHPGAREAVVRWMTNGFFPTLEETRSLHLDPVWSPDPRSHEPAPAQRRTDVARFVFFAAAMAFLGVVLALMMTLEESMGAVSWIVLIALGWIPLLFVPIFLVQAVRAARPVRHDAGVSRHGWFDVLHDRGLIPLDQITGMRTTEDGLEVQLTGGALTYPPLEGTLACARRAARDFEVSYEMRRRTS